jgi:hypothetical protein
MGEDERCAAAAMVEECPWWRGRDMDMEVVDEDAQQ